MNFCSMFKKSVKPEEITRSWYIVDAKGKILGRISNQIARILQGKHKAYYTPYWDMGDFVVVINAKNIAVTGRKEKQKIYYRHSGYAGALKEETLGQLRKRRPTEIIKRAVKGMMPKNRLARVMMKKLYIYEGNEHPYTDKKFEILNSKL